VHAACTGEKEEVLVRKLEGKKPLGRPRHRLDNDIKINLKEIGRDGMDWIHVAQDRDQWWALVNMAMNFLNSKKNAGNFFE
jgi:hypothetical protein